MRPANCNFAALFAAAVLRHVPVLVLALVLTVINAESIIDNTCVDESEHTRKQAKHKAPPSTFKTFRAEILQDGKKLKFRNNRC